LSGSGTFTGTLSSKSPTLLSIPGSFSAYFPTFGIFEAASPTVDGAPAPTRNLVYHFPKFPPDPLLP
jgi:hypothetical protein